jgi:hypothetical protein
VGGIRKRQEGPLMVCVSSEARRSARDCLPPLLVAGHLVGRGRPNAARIARDACVLDSSQFHS